MRVSQKYVQLVPSWRDAAEGPVYAKMQAQIQAWVGNKEAAMKQLTGLVGKTGGPSYRGTEVRPELGIACGMIPSSPNSLEQAAKPIALD